MKKEKITIQELDRLGIKDPDLLILFGRVAKNLLKQEVMAKASILANFEALIADPASYAIEDQAKFNTLAVEILRLKESDRFVIPARAIQPLRKEIVEFPVFGAGHIEAGAMAQMKTAARLPIAVAGALMPDAHQGYGLPIGGVLATDADKIIPYAIGVDIACRMCLSIYDLPAEMMASETSKLKKLLLNHTHFGLGSKTNVHHDTTLFDRPEWNAIKTVRALKDKAYAQLGTSGTGNHFVEWGALSIPDHALEGIPAGHYLALLSHSGSRGFGGSIANTYSSIAMKKTPLPNEAKHLAWLDLNSEEGQEYWLAMNLAGDYASANHHEIHNKIAKALNINPVMRIENHHNFAWKETLENGMNVMVHRKGATPAGKGVLGIIPGSMSTPGFVVKGKGESTSLRSASHGAGRLMSRSAAFRTINKDDVMRDLREKNITLIGSGLDEAPMVYKDIHAVMAAQTDLVEVLAKFEPGIVRMADPREKAED